MTNHTPGPWAIGYGTKSCAVYMKPISDGWLVRDQVAKFERTAEGEANAKLIAAAPELLAALKLAAQIIGRPDDADSKLIAEAIAKATA